MTIHRFVRLCLVLTFIIPSLLYPHSGAMAKTAAPKVVQSSSPTAPVHGITHCTDEGIAQKGQDTSYSHFDYPVLGGGDNTLLFPKETVPVTWVVLLRPNSMFAVFYTEQGANAIKDIDPATGKKL